jgi:hypothetical protein
MQVLIGGMCRSGSTFSFNISREVLLRTGRVIAAAADSFDGLISATDNDVHFMVKGHAPADTVTRGIQIGNVKCICTIRKPEDAIASSMHAFGFDLERSIVDESNWLLWYSSVYSRVLTIDYKIIDASPSAAVLLIDQFLTGGNCSIRATTLAEKYGKAVLKEKFDKLQQDDSNTTNIGFSYYDNETFFHRRHVSSVVSRPARQVISAANIDRIRVALSKYVDQEGNLKPVTEWRSNDEASLPMPSNQHVS